MDVSKTTDKRFFINLIKGVAVFLMLWGHCIQYCVTGSDIDFFENSAFKFIYSFHMPLFMLVSGYLFFFSFQKRNLKELLVHRVQGMLHPIIFGNIFCYLITTFLFGIVSGNYTNIFNGGWMSSLTSLWFLWSVLSASVVVSLVCKKVNGVVLQILLLMILALVVALFPNAEMNLYMYPYFLLGFYFAKFSDNIPKWVKNIRFASLMIYPIMLYFFGKKHYIYTTGLFSKDYSVKECVEIDIYRWAIGLVGSVFVITILYFIYKNILPKFNKLFISRGLASLGENSLQIYVLSVPILSVYLMVVFPYVLKILNIENIFVRNEFVYSFLFTLMLSVAYAIALQLILTIMKKLKLSKLIFGR